MQVRIIILTKKNWVTALPEHKIQGLGNAWQKSLGHGDLSHKMHNWALGVLETGTWPRPQIIGGQIACAICAEQAEVDRVKSEQKNKDNMKQNEVLQVLQNHTECNNCQTLMTWSTNNVKSGNSAKKTNANDIGNDIVAQLGLNSSDNGDEEDGGGPNGNGGNNANNERIGRFGGSNGRSFIAMNFRNVTITPFSGGNSHTIPYMSSNNAIRRLMLPQRFDGEIVLKILDEIQTMGATTQDLAQLHNLANKYPKAAEFDTAIKSTLLIWITRVANNVVKYIVNNGFDAWHGLYHKYVPLAKYLQNMLIHELLCLQPMPETELHPLLNEVKRITNSYVKARPTNEWGNVLVGTLSASQSSNNGMGTGVLKTLCLPIGLATALVGRCFSLGHLFGCLDLISCDCHWRTELLGMNHNTHHHIFTKRGWDYDWIIVCIAM